MIDRRGFFAAIAGAVLGGHAKPAAVAPPNFLDPLVSSRRIQKAKLAGEFGRGRILVSTDPLNFDLASILRRNMEEQKKLNAYVAEVRKTISDGMVRLGVEFENGGGI